MLKQTNIPEKLGRPEEAVFGLLKSLVRLSLARGGTHIEKKRIAGPVPSPVALDGGRDLEAVLASLHITAEVPTKRLVVVSFQHWSAR